eukprot:TRINITY_DN41073_c0_g1_i1.p1 TRINITY_DN41073_c0_g1~~TRINITY_DN41073_c0_g1_i1.p1  ORF type:complete len:438 (+),score=98.66 TRINITY_DN41073_c0_g1_i1:56-1315(+)
MPCLAETAMEAWSECRPEGMKLSAAKLPMLLPAISLRIPGGTDTPERAQKLNTVFKARGPDGQEPSLFEEWAHPHDGQVEFLYFWRAFADAAHFVDNNAARRRDDAGGDSKRSAGSASSSSASGGARDAGDDVSQALGAEVEALRDSLLQRCEEAKAQSLSTTVLMNEVNAAAAASRFPRFWSTVVATADGFAGASGGELSLQELALLMLPWIQEASTWQQQDLERQQRQDARRREREEGLVVNVHVYDVSQEEKIQKLNRVLAHEYSPIKLGGVFHAGVEVLGLEWSYGFSDDETRPGVSCNKPRLHPCHHYRQTVVLGKTELSEGEIGALLSSMLEEYPGDDYDLLRRNCVHFASDFARRLGVGSVPGWVCRLATIGAGVETALQKARGIPGLDGAMERVMGAVLPEAPEAEFDGSE